MRLRIVDVLGAQLAQGERAVDQQVNVFAETDFVRQRGLEGARASCTGSGWGRCAAACEFPAA